MLKFIKKHYALLIILILVLSFFWKVLIKNLIPFPGDMLVGAYYPWLEYKWGTITGVPVKNPYITDTFSQIYLWKQLIADSYKNLEWPLWNVFSYSGYPLLANFQSGALNIFNLIFVIFGMINGWSIFLITGVLFSAFSMYFYLREIQKSEQASIIGSLIFCFSGFPILWIMYANASYSLAIIPLIFTLTEKFVKTNKYKYLLYISPCLFFLVTAGHLQILVYGFIITFSYLIFRIKKSLKNIKYIIFTYLIALFMSLVQLIPTLELSSLSIRFNEGFIGTNNFGLSPLNKLVTLFAPDFFGNPSTYNYWGFFNYHETNFYVGIFGLFSLIYSLFNYKKFKIERFFILTALITLLLGFDTFLGQIIYKLNIPVISTSAAGRIASIFSLSIAIISAGVIDQILKSKIKYTIFTFITLLVPSLTIFLLTFYFSKNSELFVNMHIAQRNMIFPFLLLFSISTFLLLVKKSKLFILPIILLITFDLFRFGWKSTPFVKKDYVFPTTPLIEKIKEDKDIFRIDREYGPIMPPNTWTAYNLMSASGYDPLSDKNYVIQYNKLLNKNTTDDNVTRYSELFHFDSEYMGQYNIKYLLLNKNTDKKNIYNQNFDIKKWQLFYETEKLSVFKNPDFKPRVEVLNDKNSSAQIIKYSPNIVEIKYNSTQNNKLVLRDSYYPGWIAKLNNKLVPIDKYLDIYRQVDIEKGENSLIYQYKPKSFFYSLYISIFTFFIWFLLIVRLKKNND